MSASRRQSPHPECDRLAAVHDQMHRLDDFLEWLHERDLHLAEWVYNVRGGEDRMAYISKSREQLLYEYFDIDAAKLEAERRAILDALSQNKSREGGEC